MQINFRDLQNKDIEPVMDFLKKIHPYTAFSAFTPNRNKVGELLHESIKNKNKIKCCIATHDDDLLGILIAYTSEMWFSSDCIASDFLIYVDQSYTANGIGSYFIDDLMRWSIECKVKKIILSDNFGSKYTHMSTWFDGLMKKFNFEKIGSSYQWAVV